MKSKKRNIKEILIYLIIITLPIMKITEPFGKLKINLAISDFFVVMLLGLIVIDFCKGKYSLKSVYEHKTIGQTNIQQSLYHMRSVFASKLQYFWYFGGLLILLLISNTRAYFNPNIQSVSLISIINEATKFIIAGCYFYIGYYSFTNTKNRKKIFEIWTYTSLIVSIIGIIVTTFVLLGQPIDTDLIINTSRRLVGTLTDPNLAAAYLNISFYIVLMFVKYTEDKKRAWVGYISLVLISVSIILTQSRSGITAFGISLIIYFILNYKYILKKSSIFFLICILIFLAGLKIDSSYFNKSISNDIQVRLDEMINLEGESNNRLVMTKVAFEMGKDHIIFGVGRGNYRSNATKYFELLGYSLKDERFLKLKNNIPHNTYVTFFCELGILGLFLFCSIFLKALFRQLANLKINNYIWPKLLLAMLLAYLIQAIAINLENFRAIWIVLAIALCISSDKINISSELPKKKAFQRGVAILLIIASSFLFLDIVDDYPKVVNIYQEKEFILDNIVNEKEYLFASHLLTEANDLKIIVFSISGSKEEYLTSLSYENKKGQTKIAYSTLKDTEKIKVRVLSKGEIKMTNIKNILIDEKEAVNLFDEYRFLPQKLAQFLEDIGFIHRRNNLVSLDSYHLLKSFNSQNMNNKIVKIYPGQRVYSNGSKIISFNNQIDLIATNIEKFNKNRMKLSFVFKCSNYINRDYNLLLHMKVRNKDNLEKSSRKINEKDIQYSEYTLAKDFTNKTSLWEINDTYVVDYVLDLYPGEYEFALGFWTKQSKEEQSLISNMIDLGWLQID